MTDETQQKQGISPRQKIVYDLLCRMIQEGAGVCPSIRELAAARGMKGNAGTHAILKQLEARGWITMPNNRARSITIL